MKRTLRTRTVAALAITATGALVLAGCGASGGDSGSGDGVTLTFSSWLPTQDQWTDLIAAFEDENPDINIEFSRDEDYAAYLTNLDNAILAGESPTCTASRSAPHSTTMPTSRCRSRTTPPTGSTA